MNTQKILVQLSFATVLILTARWRSAQAIVQFLYMQDFTLVRETPIAVLVSALD